MNKHRFAFRTFVLVGLFFAFSAAADAQVIRTWVASTGLDTNSCSRTAPCKSFAAAIAATSVGGEINCLDPNSEYGVIQIDKSITIDCEDTQGTTRAAAANGININITDPADTAKSVRIRGFTINGLGNGTNGIRVQSANRLTLEEVVIDGFTAHGISVETTSGAFSLVAKKTTVRNNAGNGINTSLSGAATATIFLIDSLIAANSVGFNQNSATVGVVQNSTFTGNTTGVQANGSTSVLALKGCLISQNGTGVSTVTSATIRIGGNIITANTTGLTGSDIYTWGGNLIDGNASNGTNSGRAAVQ
ncbi:MAG TPA: hypothetical protein VGC76_10820 [Pyrinomonadaceae bacterium]|jgi:hypothetical protein